MKTNADIEFGPFRIEYDLAQPLCFLFGWNFRTGIVAIGLPFVIVSWNYK